ncbi:MAG: hypothetical protein MI673_04095 [Thiotrichales bacterium]|nr:hypothetical protein [Thiotrichales bacterium]
MQSSEKSLTGDLMMKNQLIQKVNLITAMSFLLVVAACGGDEAAPAGSSATSSAAAPAQGSSTVAASGGMSSSHPALEGVERAEGVVYYDEIYKN